MNSHRPPSTAQAEPLYERIRLSLREDILGGGLPPGSRVPSENNLGLRYGVSRITVRQALAALQQEGLIFTRQGKGSFVSRPKAFQNVNTLQGFGEQMAPLGYEVLNQLRELREVPASARVAARLGMPAGEPGSLTHQRFVLYSSRRYVVVW